MVLCEICGEEFETSQGLAGHKQFKHGAKGAEHKDSPESKAITRPQPLDSVIENLRLPQVPEAYNGQYNVYVAGFNDGVMHGARSILAGIRAAQELSSVGVQQAVPLIKMAQEMRQAEGQAAQTIAAQLGQLTMQSNQQILSAIHDMAAQPQAQGPASDTNPLAKAVFNAMQPYIVQTVGRLFSSIFKMPQPAGQPQGEQTPVGHQPAEPAEPKGPPPHVKPGEEGQWTET